MYLLLVFHHNDDLQSKINQKKINIKYLTYLNYNTIFNWNSLTKTSKKNKIYDENNYFWGYEAIMYRCCST